MVLIDIFMAISTMLGVVRVPSDNPAWVTAGWQRAPAVWTFTAQNNHITRSCAPGKFLVAPPVIHAAHVFSQGGRPVYLFGRVGEATPFYGQPAVPCELLGPGPVTWEVQGHTEFFSRVPYWPEVRARRPWQGLFYEPLQVAASIALLAIGTFVGFTYDIRRKIVSRFCAAAAGMAVYFALSTVALLQAQMTPLSAHAGADIAVWVGILGVFAIFHERSLIHTYAYRAIKVAVLAGTAVMLSATDGDAVQAGTMLPFTAAFFAIGNIVARTINAAHKQPTRRRFVELVSTLCFVASGGNEMLVVLGVLPESPTCLQVGMVGTILFLAMAIHEDFVYLLAERAYLQQRIVVGDLALKVADIQNEILELTGKQRLGNMGPGGSD